MFRRFFLFQKCFFTTLKRQFHYIFDTVLSYLDPWVKSFCTEVQGIEDISWQFSVYTFE